MSDDLKKAVVNEKKPITKGVEVKDSTLKKAAKLFFAEDIDHVTDSIVDEFVKPRATSFGLDLVKKFKEFMFKSLSDLAHEIIFGNGGKKSDSYYNNGYSSYTKYYYGDDYYGSSGYKYRSTSGPDDREAPHDQVKKVAIPSHGEALDVLNNLRSDMAMNERRQVSIASYYQLVGLNKEINSLDYSFGWKRGMLDGNIPITYMGKGYVINFPKPVPLD